jgi:hypothetical protein
MDLTDVQTALKTWVSGATGIDTRWANQDAPRDAYPFCVLTVSSLENVGQDTTSLVYDAVDREYDVCVSAHRRLVLNVQVFADTQRPASDARMYLEAANLSLRKPSVRQALLDDNIALVSAGNAVNLSQAIGGVQESRWSQDFTFNVAYEWTGLAGEDVETVESIETVLVDNESVDPAESITITVA